MPVSIEERPSRQTVLERAERRERIATRVLAAQAASVAAVSLGAPDVDRLLVSTSIGLANLLMDTLDVERDAELAEAR